MSMKHTVAIVEDDALTRNILESFVNRTEHLALRGCFADTASAASFLSQEEVDIIILDVELPGMSGFDLLGSLTRRPQVVVVSGKNEYAAEAFNVEAADFLSKPIAYPRFLKALNRAIASCSQPSQGHMHEEIGKLPLKDKGGLIAISLEDLRCMESSGYYTFLYTAQKKYVQLASLKSILSRLPSDQFVRVHKSWVVNVNEISKIETGTLCVRDKVIPLGNGYKNDLMTRFRSI